MKRLLIVVFGVAWAFAGFRNLPRLTHPQASTAGLVVAVMLGLAYWAGTCRKRDLAVAVAVAKAEATALAAVQATTTSAANVTVVLDPAIGAARRGAAEFGLEDAPWMVGAHRAVELDEREALDVALEDVLDERDRETA